MGGLLSKESKRSTYPSNSYRWLRIRFYATVQKPLLDDSTSNTNQQWLFFSFKVVQDFVHAQYVVCFEAFFLTCVQSEDQKESRHIFALHGKCTVHVLHKPILPYTSPHPKPYPHPPQPKLGEWVQGYSADLGGVFREFEKTSLRMGTTLGRSACWDCAPKTRGYTTPHS